MLVHWHFFNTPQSGTILDLEFARNYAAAQLASQQWQQGAVIFNIVLDYVFLTAYGIFFYVSVQRLGHILTGVWGQAAAILKWFGPLAALCDAVENLLMLLFLTNGTGPNSFTSPFVWAVVKFALVAVVILFYFVSTNIFIDRVYTRKS